MAEHELRNRRKPTGEMHCSDSKEKNGNALKHGRAKRSGQQYEECIPLGLKPWVYLYRFIPKIYLPASKLDISFTIASMMFLTLVDYGSALLFGSRSGWPTSEVRKVAGSITTIFHSTVLVMGLGSCLLSQKYAPSCRMDTHPVWWQDGATALIQFCSGYMCYDVLVQFVADRWVAGSGPVLSKADFLFVGHHIATLLYMTSTRLIEAGHLSAIMLMFLGELTAPPMNVLRISQAASSLGVADWLQQLHPTINIIFALLYVPCRVVLGPICGLHLTANLLFSKEGRANIPILLSLAWLALCWGVMLGSIPWIKNAMKTLQGESVQAID